ncbi:MAG: hypothetical protein R6U43_04230 [Candidatus Krumholzibacteriales bacterium]
MLRKLIFPGILFFTAAIFLCCGEKEEDTGTEGINGKEDCLKILETAYRDRDIGRYKEIFLKPDSAGVFPEGFKMHYLRENIDSGKFSLSLNYSQEIEMTAGLFKHADSIRVNILPSGWERVEELRGRECGDCWKSEREYELMVRLDDEKEYNGHFLTRFVVGPDPRERGKYLIYQIEIAPPHSGSGLDNFPLGYKESGRES